ncbi:MAG: Asp23/Gls24 family envelope stress response protein [Lachnospiraceae bacterium]|nr:Asp23/Gls24 family envelope stress response protein [Lachnospiraceae bacterium]
MEESVRNKLGEVRIADEVVCAIAGLAAVDTRGVSSLAGGITNDRIATTGLKNLGKAVRIAVSENAVEVRIAVILDGSVSIPECTVEIQKKVKNSIESMTGMEVTNIQVVVAGVTA